MSLVQLLSTLTCPNCAGVSQETMPTDACQFFYDCRHCGEVLRPLKGDCCVFCSYADVPCPPIQEARRSGNSAACCAS
ncbi:MAG: GDCCVxC domain-containing (seleno)protein [Sphingomicrobium sp.]|nr:hypothetical protein [Sphingomonadales bacterium]